MESMTPLIVLTGIIFALDNYASVMAARRGSGQDAPDRAADLRAQGWRAAAKAMRSWLIAWIMGSAGGLFAMRPFLAPESTLGRAVSVFGGGLLLFGAVLALSGASSLVTAFGRFRDAKRLAGEIRP